MHQQIHLETSTLRTYANTDFRRRNMIVRPRIEKYPELLAIQYREAVGTQMLAVMEMTWPGKCILVRNVVRRCENLERER